MGRKKKEIKMEVENVELKENIELKDIDIPTGKKDDTGVEVIKGDYFRENILWKYYAHSDIGEKEPSILFREDPDINVFSISTYEDIFYPSNDIWITDNEGRKKILKTYFREELKYAQENNLTTIGVEEKVNKKTGESVITYHTLDETTKSCRSSILRNEYLYINSDKIVNFTNDPKKPSFSYLNLDTLIKKDYVPEDWFKFESQMPNKEVVDIFRAFIYSLFLEKNKGRQMLILLGVGQTGKSTILRVIEKFFNTRSKKKLFVSSQPSKFNGDFFTSSLLSCRVMFVNDSDNPQIHTYSLIKNITGGDSIPINIKFGPMFSTKLNIKIMGSLNTKLNLDISKSEEISRVLLIPLEVSSDPEIMKEYYYVDDKGDFLRDGDGNLISKGNPPDKEENLLKQFPWYLSLCKDSYNELCPEDGNIKISPDYIRDILGGHSFVKESDSLDIIDIYFDKNPNGFISNTVLKAVVDDYNEKNNMKEDFKIFREKFVKLNSVKRQDKNKPLKDPHTIEGKLSRGFRGFSLKPEFIVSATTNSVKYKKDIDE